LIHEIADVKNRVNWVEVFVSIFFTVQQPCVYYVKINTLVGGRWKTNELAACAVAKDLPRNWLI